MTGVDVHRIRSQEWRAWRSLRLEALADTPIGFLEVLADAEAAPDTRWQERVDVGAASEDRSLFLAWDADRPVGSAGGWWSDGSPYVIVIAVYVTPSARADGVLDLLLGAVEEWARGLPGVSELRLEVHEDNARARAAYSRRGFVETGLTKPYPPDPSRQELEMVRPL